MPKAIIRLWYKRLPTVAAPSWNRSRNFLMMVCIVCISLYVLTHKTTMIQGTIPNSFVNQDPIIGRELIRALKLSSKNSYCASRSPNRYNQLRDDIRNRNARFLIAVNFFNNQLVIPDFTVQLDILINFLGAENIQVSIYENGSEDQTKTYLELLRTILQRRKVSNTIQFSYDQKDPHAHRIDMLARVRNLALDPVFTQTDETKFEKVIFMNDVFFCADDIKELLHQSYIQKSDLTCGLDFDTDKDGVGFYDTWVARNRKGGLFEKRPLEGFAEDQQSNERIRKDLPFQVFCCWNGAAVISAKAFYGPNGLRFHRAFTEIADESHSEVLDFRKKHFYNGVIYKSCSGSEINNFCHDMHSMGLQRAVVVPSVKVAYDWPTYYELRDRLFPMNKQIPAEADIPIAFEPPPESSLCHPMNGNAQRSPDGAKGWELLKFPPATPPLS